MDEVLGQRPSNNLPVLIASIPGNTISAVAEQDEEEPTAQCVRGSCGHVDETDGENLEELF